MNFLDFKNITAEFILKNMRYIGMIKRSLIGVGKEDVEKLDIDFDLIEKEQFGTLELKSAVMFLKSKKFIIVFLSNNQLAEVH